MVGVGAGARVGLVMVMHFQVWLFKAVPIERDRNRGLNTGLEDQPAAFKGQALWT